MDSIDERSTRVIVAPACQPRTTAASISLYVKVLKTGHPDVCTRTRTLEISVVMHGHSGGGERN
jgi:hypothetical protein